MFNAPCDNNHVNRKPSDINQLAASIVGEAVGEEPRQREKNPLLQAAGKKGGHIGGRARAERLSTAELSEIGRKGASSRWSDPRDAPAQEASGSSEANPNANRS